MQRIAIGIVMVIAVVALAACESAEKAPAAAAISAAQSAIDAVKGEAMKYVPDQVKSAQDAVAAARASFEKNDFKAALAGAQDATAKAKELGAAVATKKSELTKSWEEMSNGVPKMAEVIKSRVDILSQSKKLPAGVDRAKLDDAKAGLASVNENWAAASNAFKSGDMFDAVSKGKSAKDKAVEIMTALNMTVPQAATR